MPIPVIKTAWNRRSRPADLGDHDAPIHAITMPIQVITMAWNR
jgi:hypothetical protein